MLNDALIIKIGEETSPIIECPDKMGQSLFSNVYGKAFDVLCEYTQAAIEDMDKKDVVFNGEQRNNIFSVIGERGSGKTSCMFSIEKALKEGKKLIPIASPADSDNTKTQGYKVVDFDNASFHSVGLIDPSFFDKSNNILTMVLASMFARFKSSIEDKKFDCDGNGYLAENRQSLISCFQEVKKDIDILFNPDSSSGDSLDSLVSRAAAYELSKHMRKLITRYLKYFSDEKSGKRQFLLLTIDDIDLHTTHAYDMVEQIRKYLILPNVVILMAVKLDQLETVIRKHYVKEFSEIKDKGFFAADIRAMGERYLEKLIPLNRRLYLPTPSLYLNRELRICKVDSETPERVFSTIKEGVLSLIFKKTRFLFYNASGKTSYIVPRNLRELRHLLVMLYNMKEYNDEQETIAKYNKESFRKYFLETWISGNLSDESQSIIREFMSADVISKNKVIVQRLAAEYKDNLSDDSEAGLITDSQNASYNTSLGDVLYIVNRLSERIPDEESQKLFFAIKSIYSILLYEYYDELTEYPENEDREWGRRFKLAASSDSQAKLFRKDYLEGYSNYEKFVGGSFINSSGNRFLPYDKSNNSRSQRLIDGAILKNILTQIDDIDSEKSTIDNAKIEVKGKSIKYVDAIKLLEFFALTIPRRDDARSKTQGETYFRKWGEAYYDRDKVRVQKNYWFDIASVIYNIVFLKDTYDKIFPGLTTLAKNTSNDTILNKIEKDTQDRDGKGDRDDWHEWLSWACIRNTEILEDWMQFRQDDRPSGSGNDIDVLAGFFKNNGVNSENGYKIRTYDKKSSVGDSDHYEISFGFFDIIGEFLSHVSTDESLRTVFDLIFNVAIEEDKHTFEELKDNINAGETPFMPRWYDLNQNSRIKKNFRNHYILDRIDENMLNEYFPNKQKSSKSETIKKLSEIISKIDG